MKTLVIGQGGREHAIAKALHLSASVTAVHALPGSDGMASTVLCHSVKADDFAGILEVVRKHQIDLVVIGPENPLVDGLSDALREAGVLVFGPSKNAARLEGSKVFAKEFMKNAGVPTAAFSVVSSVDETMTAAADFTPPYVLKADGLAAGKGVAICKDLDELKHQSQRYFDEKVFGSAGETALLEQFQGGWEMSFHILTNGSDYIALPLSQDHKRIGEGDTGPNTGGMGTVAPLGIDHELYGMIEDQVLKPSVNQLAKQGLDFFGVLFIGLMITPQGPRVIEYNVRFGDPETQVMFPLLDGDWGEVLSTVAKGEMPEAKWKPLNSACVVLAAEGYPDSPKKGVEISGDPLFESASSYFLHAGTKKSADSWLTNGGRVLNAVAMGTTLEEAINNAYEQVSQVEWPGMQVRRDIGQKVLHTS